MNLYIHIPFCQKKCGYCAFASISDGERLFSAYCSALKKELLTFPKKQLSTLFIGGGTPTSLPSEQLCGLLDFLKNSLGFTDNAEITVEANPGTVDLPYLFALRQSGVNRLSLGAQSFDNRELYTLGRIHNKEAVAQAVECARKAGFTNLSLDLIYGLPGQTPDQWQLSLNQAIALKPEHLSLYQLTPEEKTPFFEKLKKGEISFPAEETLLEMDSITAKLTTAAGYNQYEISNYSLPGVQCRHNCVYWLNEPWYGAGAAAVSYLNGCRAKRVDDPSCYIQRIKQGKTPIVETENLDHEASFRETVIMGLRMNAGVEKTRLQKRFGIDIDRYYGDILKKLTDQKLLIHEKGALRLSRAGRSLANQVMSALV